MPYKPTYIPRAGVLRDVNLPLANLAEITYTRLSDEDRERVNQLALELDQAMLAKRRGPHGIGKQGMRELALALVLRLMEPGKIMDQVLINGVMRKCKESDGRTG
jgi:hypothetical protein